MKRYMFLYNLPYPWDPGPTHSSPLPVQSTAQLDRVKPTWRGNRKAAPTLWGRRARAEGTERTYVWLDMLCANLVGDGFRVDGDRRAILAYLHRCLRGFNVL